jgi:hypothetical protein
MSIKDLSVKWKIIGISAIGLIVVSLIMVKNNINEIKKSAEESILRKKPTKGTLNFSLRLVKKLKDKK